MKVCLLDVNVLIALAWPSHVSHRQAREWFEGLGRQPWATCPMTQAGFVRGSANRHIVHDPVSPQEAVATLRRLVLWGHHEFWPDAVDLTESQVFPLKLLMGHRQVTDACLLTLAIERGGILVTLDRSVGDLLPAKSAHHAALTLLR